tara:strand:- start:29689 stop:31557 length:1869 start_codon:yes stop_codon:yes gene_type:complete
MCGIAGVIGSNINISTDNIKKLDQIINHRGPDFQNYLINKNYFLYHARLSIIDLRNVSNQPMLSSDKKFLIIFNGEIYNYVELKKKIKNYNFKTNSDTEVILAAYKKWGKKCLDKLAGAFSFLIYDIKKKETFFARDRFGQKPFFFNKTNSHFKFASEIKGLIALGLRPKENKKIWHNYLINGITDETEETFFQKVKQLLPGHYGLLNSRNQLKIFEWYNLKKKIKLNKDSKNKNIKKKILSRLKDSIKKCSRADVPISVSLSGGLDSAILFSIHAKNNFARNKPKSFSVSFGKDFSEKKYIDLTTNKFKAHTNHINFSINDWIKSINPSIWHLESPSGGLITCALSKIYHHINKSGYKVVQDATGLDEIFGGYEYHHLLYLNKLKNNSNKNFLNEMKNFCENWNYKPPKALEKITKLTNKIPKTIDSYNLINNSLYNEKFVKKYHNNNKEILDLKKSFVHFIQNSKIPRNNRLKDRLSMAFGLELRLPFLENDLVEYGLSLQDYMYFINGRSKSILRESVKGILDNKVRLAKKFSIQSPQNIWFKNKFFVEFFDEIINSESFKSREIYNVKKVKKVWKNFLNSKKNNTSFHLWQIINYEIWNRIFIDNNPLEKKYKFNYEI